MKGLAISVGITLAMLFGIYWFEPVEKPCKQWEKVTKSVFDPKSKLTLTGDVAVCLKR